MTEYARAYVCLKRICRGYGETCNMYDMDGGVAGSSDSLSFSLSSSLSVDNLEFPYFPYDIIRDGHW